MNLIQERDYAILPSVNATLSFESLQERKMCQTQLASVSVYFYLIVNLTEVMRLLKTCSRSNIENLFITLLLCW